MTSPDASGPIARLFDAHLHTEFAYCAEDTTAKSAVAAAREAGLAGAGVVEHADQLYFPREGFWKRADADDLDAMRASVEAGGGRMAEYRAHVAPLRSDFVRLGLEVEPAVQGGLALLEEDRDGWDFFLGGVHHLSEMNVKTASDSELAAAFMRATEKVVAGGVDALAHPFRFFGRHERRVPTDLYRPLAGMLTAHGVAAEINFHTNEPDPAFFAICLAEGVKLATGSDAHARHEAGKLAPHLALLSEIGALDRLDEILWRPG